jgi:hypothetical protein
MKEDGGVEVRLHKYLINTVEKMLYFQGKPPGGPWRRSGRFEQREKKLLPPRKIDPRIVHTAVA